MSSWRRVATLWSLNGASAGQVAGGTAGGGLTRIRERPGVEGVLQSRLQGGLDPAVVGLRGEVRTLVWGT